MRKLFLSLLSFGTLATQAQTSATFESLTLPTLDTAYINFTQPGQDVGFADGLAFFPSVYDTSGGASFWNGGFAYSNERDTTTGNVSNQYAAKAGGGFGGSQKYAVYYEPYSGVRKLRLTGTAQGQAVRGFYITNTTYTYASMKNGDFFVGPRFGDTSATDTTHARPDFLRVVARGYRAGAMTPDSAQFFLADFRAGNNVNDYIVKDWQWFSLLPLGAVDSVDFQLVSSRIGAFGNNVPAYFAMDNFTTDETATGIRATAQSDLKIFPNPATGLLFIESARGVIARVDVVDVAGRTVLSRVAIADRALQLDVAALTSGIYRLRISGEAGTAVHTFTKR